jgi:hypothetical protein
LVEAFGYGGRRAQLQLTLMSVPTFSTKVPVPLTTVQTALSGWMTTTTL